MFSADRVTAVAISAAGTSSSRGRRPTRRAGGVFPPVAVGGAEGTRTPDTLTARPEFTRAEQRYLGTFG